MVDLSKMMAKLFGREPGYCKGSIHIAAPEIGIVVCEDSIHVRRLNVSAGGTENTLWFKISCNSQADDDTDTRIRS